jgi:hypothetical protein
VDLTREGGGKSLVLIRSKFSPFWHGNFELQDQQTFFLLIAEERHAEVLHYFFIAVPDDLAGTGVDVVLLAVEVFEYEVEAE